MSLYQKIKSAITVRQVGEMYGMEPDRRGMVCCPFHSDNHPSMMLNDTYYYCFGCGANGDAIDLTVKLFDLNPRQAAEKLNDFAFAKQCSPQWGLQVTERSCVSKMEGPRPDKLRLFPGGCVSKTLSKKTYHESHNCKGAVPCQSERPQYRSVRGVSGLWLESGLEIWMIIAAD